MDPTLLSSRLPSLAGQLRVTWWKGTLTLVVLFYTTALLQVWEHSSGGGRGVISRMSDRVPYPPWTLLMRPCLLRGVANTVLFVGFSKLLKHGEEGLGFAGDCRATVQGPWGAKHHWVS